MSTAKRRKSGGTRPEIAPYLETINDLLGTGSSEEKSNKAKSVKSTVLGSATEKILDLVKEKENERRALMDKTSNGLHLLLGCLKESTSNTIINNVLQTLLCLCENRYKGRMVRRGTVDNVLESLSIYSASDSKRDECLIFFSRLLLELNSKDNNKLALKARHYNVVGVIVHLLKTNIKNATALPVVLSFIRILAVNSTNALEMGTGMNVMPQFVRLLTLYGETEYTVVKSIVKALIPLIKQKTNARKIPGVVAKLVHVLHRLHSVDTHGRHIPLRKSIVSALSIAITVDPCMLNFHKNGCLQTLYIIAKGLHENLRPETRSLANLTCGVLRKCLPLCPLLIDSPENPVSFSFHSVKHHRCLSEEPYNRQDSISDSSQTSVTPELCMDLEPTANSDPSLEINEQEPHQLWSKLSDEAQEVLLPPSLSYFISIDNNGSGNDGSPKSVKCELSSLDQFFPEFSFISPKLSRSASLPALSLISREATPIRTSLSESSVDCKSSIERISIPEKVCPPKVIVTDLINGSSDSSSHSIFSELSAVPHEVQYKKSLSVDRELTLADAERFVQSEGIYRTAFDLDRLVEEVPLVVDHLQDGGGDDDTAICDGKDLVDKEDVDLLDKEEMDSLENMLIFKASSESCNLRKAIQVREYEYDLILNADVNTNHHHQWFLFEVSNAKCKVPYRFNIINCEKPNSLFNTGMQPLLYSTTTKCWQRVGTNISYYRNNYYIKKQTPLANASTKDKLSKPSTKRFYTVTFTIEFPTSDDVYYLAYHYPYTYSMLQADLSTMEKSLLFHSPQMFYRHQTLCYTLSGHPCPVLTVTNLPRKIEEEESKEKKYVVLSARVHPGEPNSSWLMKGVIQFLLSDVPEANKLRDSYVFKIIPMLNPDGVINGNHRCSLSGQDLNRQWISPDPVLHPTIYKTKGLLQWLVNNGKSPHVFCDFHGHSRKKNVFIYGCRDPLKSCVEEELPAVLNGLAPLFSLQNCSFVVEKSKEGTARVVVWKRLGIKRSYTMECTYCGPDQGLLKGKQVNISDLLEMGKWFCIGLSQLSEGSYNAQLLNEVTTPSETKNSQEEEDHTEMESEVDQESDTSESDEQSDIEEATDSLSTLEINSTLH